MKRKEKKMLRKKKKKKIHDIPRRENMKMLTTHTVEKKLSALHHAPLMLAKDKKKYEEKVSFLIICIAGHSLYHDFCQLGNFY